MMLKALALSTLLAFPVVVPAGDFFPRAEDFRAQKIRKVAGEKDWPFMAEHGMLLCAYVLQKPTVYFLAGDIDDDVTRAFLISEDIAGMAVANVGITGVLKPFDNFEQLFTRIYPYVSLGKRLCQQPAGTLIPETEL